MGWAVGWDFEHGRHRGYGVPAYCDAYSKGCRSEIDRGLGYVCEGFDCGHYDEVDSVAVTVFVCGEHTCADVDEASLPPEHPDWVEHVLTDDTWAQWRAENAQRVATLGEGAMSAELLREAAKEIRVDHSEGFTFMLAVADWLDRIAWTWELDPDLKGRVGGNEALATARTYLGRDA